VYILRTQWNKNNLFAQNVTMTKAAWW